MNEANNIPALSIVIPVLNEEQAVGQVIDGILATDVSVPYEVVVVDDGSTDRTREILARYEARPNFRVIRHQCTKGYGASLKTGIHMSSAEQVVILDGDGTYPPDYFNEFVRLSGQYDMVVGQRTGAVVIEPVLRKWVKAAIVWLLRVLADIHVPDLNCGLRLMKKSQVQRYFNLLPDGISFTSTITLILLSEGYPVTWVPINYLARRGPSKFHPLADTVNILILIMRTILYFNPLKVFIPLSILLVLIAVFVFLFSVFYLGKFMDVTTVVILLSAVQVFVLGLLADLLTKLKK